MILNLEIANLDQIRCWESILNTDIKPGKSYKNPTRYDKEPSCKIINKDGILILYDFSEKKGRNCVKCLSEIKGIHFTKAFEELCLPVGLISKIKREFPISVKSQIDVVPKIHNSESLSFWGNRGVRKEQLERSETKVEMVESYKISYEKGGRTYYPNDLCFSYRFNNGIKMYFPERSKPRFKSTGDRNSVWHLRRGSDNLMICKANKDFLGLENICDFDLLSIASEGSSPENLLDLSKRYSRVYAGHDPDLAGLRAVAKLNESISVKHVHTNFLDGMKDWDDVLVIKGLKVAKGIFQSLIN